MLFAGLNTHTSVVVGSAKTLMKLYSGEASLTSVINPLRADQVLAENAQQPRWFYGSHKRNLCQVVKADTAGNIFPFNH